LEGNGIFGEGKVVFGAFFLERSLWNGLLPPLLRTLFLQAFSYFQDSVRWQCIVEGFSDLFGSY
jgi:hypothetical protein